jgi:SAM-dependent methyltransferase
MSHPQQMNFIDSVKILMPNSFIQKKVLEVGSLNINGSVRQFFENCDYTGIDVGEGPDVDIVCGGEEYDAPNESFDTVISCECFEHNPSWVETFQNMIRMCKSGGLIIMTCATTGREEHGTERTTPKDSPLTIAKGWNYYKNLTVDDFCDAFNLDEIFLNYEFSENLRSKDLYFWGVKY